MIEVKWAGEYPNLCSGKWILKIDGEDYSKLVPFGSDPANTYGAYSEWYFDDKYDEIWEDYTDGLKEFDWIIKNKEWIDKLPSGTDNHELFEAFQSQDWRHRSCGGCI